MNIEDLHGLKFNADGLIPAIVQDDQTKRVLMMAWMNIDSLKQTLDKKETVFFSRSRGELWHKGATSGNIQRVVSIQVDCDADCLLIMARVEGPACHTGSESCFDERALDI